MAKKITSHQDLVGCENSKLYIVGNEIDHMARSEYREHIYGGALGFGMFDFAQQEGKGTGRASTHLAESLVERRETWAKGGAARPVRRLASRGEMPKEEGVCVSVWAGAWGRRGGERNKKEAGCVQGPVWFGG